MVFKKIVHRFWLWLVSLFRKEPVKAHEVSNSSVNNSLVNNLRDKFHKPAPLRVENNRRVTRGRSYFFLSGKKHYKK